MVDNPHRHHLISSLLLPPLFSLHPTQPNPSFKPKPNSLSSSYFGSAPTHTAPFLLSKFNTSLTSLLLPWPPPSYTRAPSPPRPPPTSTTPPPSLSPPSIQYRATYPPSIIFLPFLSGQNRNYHLILFSLLHSSAGGQSLNMTGFRHESDHDPSLLLFILLFRLLLCYGDVGEFVEESIEVGGDAEERFMAAGGVAGTCMVCLAQRQSGTSSFARKRNAHVRCSTNWHNGIFVEYGALHAVNDSTIRSSSKVLLMSPESNLGRLKAVIHEFKF